MTVRTRRGFKYQVADVYDSFGMYETKILTNHDLNVIGNTRKVVVVASDDEYDRLKREFGL